MPLEHIGWCAHHAQLGFWGPFMRADRPELLEPMGRGWTWAPVYARAPA